MQSADFEEDVFKRWFRRPALFMACAWFLLAAAGRVIVPYAVALALRVAGLIVPVEWLNQPLISELVYKLGCMAFPVLYYAARRPGVDKSMRLKPPAMAALTGMAAAAVMAALFAAGVSIVWCALIEKLGGTLAQTVQAPETAGQLMSSIAIYAVLPGVCEELLFRGGILGAWERRGARKALVASSLLFCALHGSLQGLPVQLLMGFALGYVVIAGDSLFLGMVFHTLFNATTLTLAWLEQKMDIYTFIMQHEPWVSLTALLLGVLCALALLSPLLWQKRDVHAVFSSRGDRTPMGPGELLVLSAGIVTALVLFAENVLSVCGVL